MTPIQVAGSITHTMNNTHFANIIGQPSAKKKLGFFLDNHLQRNVPMKNVFLNAPKGCGKTTFARTIAAVLKKHDANKEYVELNCGGIKNAKQFCEQIMLTRVVDRDVTILFDEAHDLDSSVATQLLTLLNPNDNHTNRLSYDEFDFDVDFRRQTFLFATTESDKVDGALKSRLEEVHLQAYTNSELAQILKLHLDKKDILAEDQTLDQVSTVIRGNAREAVKMANHIIDYMYGVDEIFSDVQWEQMKSALDILPLGITPVELEVLREIRTTGTSLSDLAAATGLTRTAISGSAETFLRQNRLMFVGEKSWRYLTQRGIDLLKQVDEAA